jgi:hypothetical protein
MTKKKVLLLIPLLLIAGLILYTWITVLFGDNILVWRHYTGLLLFIPLIYLFTKNFRKTILGTFIYLILGTCNVLTLTPSIIWNSYEIRIGSANITTPPFQILSFGLLVLLCILNFDTLVDMYLDFKEMRQPKMKENIQVDNEKILITGTSFKKEIVWSEITQMNVSKKDFMAWDRIELEIVYGDKSLTLNEDVEGWNEFVIKVKELFTSIPHDWDTIIIHLPFETNFKTIYSKA